MLKILRLVILSLFFFYNANSEVLKIFEFTEEELKSLEVRKIKGETLWSVGSNQNGNYLKAEANAVASGLGKEINIDLNKTPFLNITWKVEKDLNGIIENSKKGHDYAARVFVIKKTGATALSNRALNYVFSSNNDIDQNWFSPYTKKSVDYILSTTKQHLNEWVTVKVNIKEHFKKFHNLDVDNLDGIALMTDTDNSELLAISYYQNIFFSSN
ncbi:MAG: hypothetical protein ABS01_03520 [Pelagibacteraceae bacterium BACL5 MAG-120705-bin12]|jgi:hypothetical protein|uniref:DUF3047 domain-containing protein n=1 Tax=Candidatus Pelagibacter sp. TaxID=2024849 RepID=UPI000715AEFF|nr:MAG: hypothetical protein ABS04_04890 [Pelagibacteraceae bacterium BACL5 MAG-121015-bin10]KRO58668.1 MAG: hypothetical protein ABS05_05175 [Pelagibacteraceae bacterium BACL5 MAG-121128-bin54]KRO59681.1 MAG: hypothetical protein ABS01_03520 [Pelagibacteraceae bacterium BACL5 MAG-120705-bin12]KRO64593.1 MAG: hypothetical protein ABS03_06110 [Pelagibacteraceae bacterium BACL5 MAG-120820-bin39]KRO75260.1 MAG: hypothetical protein ABS02_01760 [Pelagibacteraceae bacterium BACL5 MAG-120813-bin20]